MNNSSISCSFITKYFLCVVVKKIKHAFFKRYTILSIELQVSNIFILNDFEMIKKDNCVYIIRSQDNFAILSLYIDDILLAVNNVKFFKNHYGMVILEF